MGKKISALKKNGFLILVITSFCLSIVCFSMGLVLTSHNGYSPSNISAEISDKQTVDFEDKVILSTKVKNSGKKDVASVSIVVEIKDKDENLLERTGGAIKFSNRGYLTPKETEEIDLEYSLNFNNYSSALQIYNTPYEDLIFSVEVESVFFADGNTTYSRNASVLAWYEALSKGFTTLSIISVIAIGVFVYKKTKKNIAIMQEKIKEYDQ